MVGLKKIQAFVRTYKNDADWMVESFVENVHREDITPSEKGKYLLKIKELGGIDSFRKLAKIVNVNDSLVPVWIDDYNTRKSAVATAQTSHTLIRATKGLEDKKRKRTIY